MVSEPDEQERTLAHMPDSQKPSIEAIFAGGPKVLQDVRGPWRSSINKQRNDGVVEVTSRGIVGDKATQKIHGGPDAALCIHLTDHYSFWRERYSIDLPPGGVGENLTISGITEDEMFVGDTVRLGTVLAQISGPRAPCGNQARYVRRKDWVKLTLRENRTGLYMRVLEPGTMQQGNAWSLVDRLDGAVTIPAINRCMYLDVDPVLAERIARMPALAEWWKQQAVEKLAAHNEHWTSTLFAQADPQQHGRSPYPVYRRKSMRTSKPARPPAPRWSQT